MSRSGRDTWVNELSPAANYGANASLTVGQTSNSKGEGDRRSFIAWDGISFPQGSTVTEVQIRLYQASVVGSCSAASEQATFAVTTVSAWDEFGVTWNSQPGISVGATESWPGLTTSNGWKTFTFNSASSNWSDLVTCTRSGICSVRIAMPVPNGEDCVVNLHSFEAQNKPELSVAYNAPSPTPLPTQAPIGQWYPIGPAGLLPPKPDLGPGEAPGRKEAGFVGEITIDPVEPNRLYISPDFQRGSQGFTGFWKTVDGGWTWKTTTDHLPTLHIGDIEIAPSRNVILIGTGNTDGSPGVGVYRSTDWGETFAPVGPSNQIEIRDLTQAGTRLWAATDQGVWYSDNATSEAVPWFQVTWSQVPDPLLSVAPVRNILVSQWNESVVYTSIYDGANVGWYRSGNSGFTWSSAFTNFTDSGGQGIASPILIHADAVIGKGGATGEDVIYAIMGRYQTVCVEGTHPARDRVFRGVVTSSTAEWVLLDNQITCTTNSDCCDDLDCACSGGICTPAPSCDLGVSRTLAVHPHNSDIIAYGNELLYRSFDGGQTFFGIGRKAMHADKWAIEFDPNNPARVFVGTDGGIWRSSSDFSDPNSFPTWSDELNSNLANNLLTRSGTPDRRNFGVSYTGSQDTGFFKGNKAGGWQRVLDFGDTASISVSPSDSNVIFTTDLGGSNVRQSRDGGGVGVVLANAPVPLPRAYPADKLVFDESPGLDRFLLAYSAEEFLAGGKRVFRASGADSATPVWSSITANGSPLPEFNSFAIVPAASGLSNFIFAGSFKEGVWRMVDATQVWSQSTNGLPAGNITRVVADTQGPCTPSACVVYALVARDIIPGRGAYRSTDAGLTWWDISRGAGVASGEELPDLDMSAMVLHPLCRNVVYVATYAGVYQGTFHDGTCSSPTGGLWHWAKFESGMPASPRVQDIRVHPESGVMRAYTWGRSAWEVRLYDPVNALRVNDGSLGTVLPESIALATSREGDYYTISWIDDRAGANNWHFFGRSFRTSPSLAPLAGEVQIDNPGMHAVQSGAVAAHPSGSLPYCSRYAWSDNRSGENHIFMEYRCTNGFVLNNDQPVDVADYPTGGNEGTNPDITFNEGDRGFVVVWERELTPSGTVHEIYAQFYSIFGVEQAAVCALGGGTNPCRVSNAGEPARDPVAASSLYKGSDYTFVAWSEDDTEIWIRKYDPAGAAITNPVLVDAFGTPQVRGMPRIAVEDPSCAGGSNSGEVCQEDVDCPSGTCAPPDVIVTWQRQIGTEPERVMRRRFDFDLVAVGSVGTVGKPPAAPLGANRQRLPWVATDLENNIAYGWQGNVNGDESEETPWNGFGLVADPGDSVTDKDFLLDQAPRFSSAEGLALARGPAPRCYNIAWHDDRGGATNVYTRVIFPPNY